MRTLSTDAARVAVGLLALAAFCLIPLETWTYGPNLCLWTQLFPIGACPACGSTRALVAFFHGDWSAAWKYNANIIVTAPGLLTLLAHDGARLWKEVRSNPSSRLRSGAGLNTVLKSE
jgi:hypothetical protein